MKSPSESVTGLVSVMMPARNAVAHVRSAVLSLVGQTYRQWELLLIDDGSTDGTVEAVERLADPRIRIFRQDQRGEAAARNHALRHASGEFLAFLDADDQFLPDHLRAVVDALEQHPQWGGVYTDGHEIDAKGRRVGRLSARRRGPFQGDVFEQLVRASDVFGPPLCLLLRTAIVRAHNLGFDERIVIGPDWDFTTSYAEVAAFGYLDRETCLYRIHPGSISHSAGSEVRRSSLAQCRRNAIRRDGFARCALPIRVYAFYDLLVNLLTGFPVLQEEVMGWPQWAGLPPAERARILRLMAGDGLLAGLEPRISGGWFARARRLDPADPRNYVLDFAHRLDPRFCRWLLRLRRGQTPGGTSVAAGPFRPRGGESRRPAQ